MEQLSLQLLLNRFEQNPPDCSAGDDAVTWHDHDCQRLKRAVLVDSIQSAFGLSSGGRNRRPSSTAWEWVMSSKDNSPFSFNQCCYSNQLDPTTLRCHLKIYYRRYQR